MSRRTKATKRKAKRAAKARRVKATSRAVIRMALAGKTSQEILKEMGPIVESPAVIRECRRILAKQKAEQAPVRD
jgi:hypothetical protein